MWEIPLRVTRAQAPVLGIRFEVARQFCSALLGEALRRLGWLRQSTAHRAARRDSPRPRPIERAHAVFMARRAVGFTEGAVSQYATRIHPRGSAATWMPWSVKASRRARSRRPIALR